MINLCDATQMTGKTTSNNTLAIGLMGARLYSALDYQRRATTDPYRLDTVTIEACDVIARKAWDAKATLRDIMSRHPNWDSKNQEIVITAVKDKPIDWAEICYNVRDYAWNQHITSSTPEAIAWSDINVAIRLVRPDMRDNDRAISAYQHLTGHTYQSSRKVTRIIRDILQAAGIWDDTAGSACQRNYAVWADMATRKTETITLHLSIDPAILMTISNPKSDPRKDTLVSCHSLNCQTYNFSAGNSGYTTDSTTMCLYTYDDTEEGNRYTRKTSRQLYMLQGGTLVQSRMYNTSGGTYGAAEDTVLYRETVRKALSECIGVSPNAWTDWAKTEGNNNILPAFEFEGYADWTYDFDCNACHLLSQDYYDVMRIGAAPICMSCGRTCDPGALRHRGAVCIDCNRPGCTCYMCGDGVSPDEAIYDVDGNVYCESCAYDYLGYCEDCEEYVDIDSLTEVWTGYRSTRSVCSNCLDNGNYICCPCCDRWIATDI